MNIDYCPNCHQLPVPLSRETFEQIIREPHLKALCDQIAAGNLDLKRDLPAVCWQAAFGGERRSNKTARPSGLFALDIDHIDQPDTLFHTFEDRLEELGIYIVHKTPSTKGLRVVALCRPEHETIADNQAWLAKELNVEHDACTRDLARLSFLVPENYFYFYNPEVFSLETETKEQEKKVEEEVKEEAKEEKKVEAAKAPLAFRGIPYADIVEKLIERTGGTPYEGERNNRLYLICRLLANITDRQADRLFQVCPRFGLSEAEVKACCESACKSARTEKLPYVLYKVLRDLGIGGSESATRPSADEESNHALPPPSMPQTSHLPPLIR